MAASMHAAVAVLDALDRRGKTVVQVHGRSMYPCLRNGVKVVICTTAYDELMPGDLIVFQNGEDNGCEVICHRLIRKHRGRCICKGDTNLFADPPVEWANVIGRVTSVLDNKMRIQAIDTSDFRSRSALLARLSYPYALYLNLLHVLGRCRWWRR